MPFRSLETLEAWLAEYRELGGPRADSARVIVQDGDGGANTGLVTVKLDRASTVVIIQPGTDGAAGWIATMEPREENVELDATGLLELSAELAAVSNLCAFLEARARAFLDDDEV